HSTKNRLVKALANTAAGNEIANAIDSGGLNPPPTPADLGKFVTVSPFDPTGKTIHYVGMAYSPADNVSNLEGTITGAVTGTMANIQDVALDTSNTYSDAAVNAAVNAAVAEINLQL